MLSPDHHSLALTNEGVGDGDLQPHPVPNFQTRLRTGHGFDHRHHVAVEGELVLLVDT